jgi:crotonobetainyl-CoA:carnitine CoA-transferase CaiB-like acyl-CoA transferase
MTVERHKVESFLYREARLMDEHAYDEWLALWTEDALYGVPCNEDDFDPERHVSIVYESRARLEWVSIAVGSEDEWRALCTAMGQPGLAQDPRFSSAPLRKKNEIELDAIIAAWTSSQDRWEVTRQLQAVGVVAIPSMSAKDIVEDRHLQERRYIVELEHPGSANASTRAFPGR